MGHHTWLVGGGGYSGHLIEFLAHFIAITLYIDLTFYNSREALESGDFEGLPLMTGTCRDEGLLLLSHILKEPQR